MGILKHEIQVRKSHFRPKLPYSSLNIILQVLHSFSQKTTIYVFPVIYIKKNV